MTDMPTTSCSTSRRWSRSTRAIRRADRHGRHLRLPARAAARLPDRRDRPRRRRGVAAGGARHADAPVQRASGYRARRRPHGRAIRMRCASRMIARSAWAPATSRARRRAWSRRPRSTTGDAAFLFTTDEEANDPRCIAGVPAPAITASPKRSSPSRRNAKRCWHIAASARRCIALPGRGGPCIRRQRAAGQRAAPRDALGRRGAGPWSKSHAHERFGGLTGLRFNIGTVEGGIKAQHDRAQRASCASASGRCRRMDIDAMHATLRALRRRRRAGAYEETFRGPALPAGDVAEAEARRLAARDLADALDLPIGNAVDFWTEASLFSAGRADRAGVRSRRHRAGPHRGRVGGARPAASATPHTLPRILGSTRGMNAVRRPRRPARPSCACCPAWAARRRSTST